MTGRQLRLLLITSEWPPPGSAVKRQAESLTAVGMAVEVFAFRGGHNFYNYAAAWTRLRPRLHPGRYDLAHAQCVTDGLIAFPRRVPLVVSVGDQPARGVTRVAARFVTRRADAIIVRSDDLCRYVRTRAPVHVIRPGLDEAAHTARLVEVYRSVVSET